MGQTKTVFGKFFYTQQFFTGVKRQYNKKSCEYHDDFLQKITSYSIMIVYSIILAYYKDDLNRYIEII